MTDDILWLALKAGFEMGEDKKLYTTDGDGLCTEELQRFAALVSAAERDHMIADGWRQCAQGQRTTQFCAVAEQARLEEREACARVADEADDMGSVNQRLIKRRIAAAIRASGNT